jgi:hypothetical protein
VHGGEDGNAVAAEAFDQVNEFKLASDVEVLGGLVEQEQRGLLGEAESDFDALTLAAAELVEDARAQGAGIGEFHGVLDGLAVGGADAAEELEVGCSALLDELLDGEAEGDLYVLRDQGDGAGDGALAERGERFAAQEYIAVSGLEGSGGKAEQGSFAATVGADEGVRSTKLKPSEAKRRRGVMRTPPAWPGGADRGRTGRR